MIQYSEYLGYVAAILTTIAFIPQVILVYKTKDTRSISLPMFILFCAGLLCWALYGILLFKIPIITANVVTLSLSGYILYMKLIEKKRLSRKQ
ncbi:MAG: SemiSWEET transporter [Cytophagaceae bacterium]|nr:SemiSWEET transporter [Cytophagaceae bacterium]MDW8456558.1 SemiSWEET transporter [Cytophagaceae bacterium]